MNTPMLHQLDTERDRVTATLDGLQAKRETLAPQVAACTDTVSDAS